MGETRGWKGEPSAQNSEAWQNSCGAAQSPQSLEVLAHASAELQKNAYRIHMDNAVR